MTGPFPREAAMQTEKKVWVGFCDGKPHQFNNDLDVKTIAVYPTKRQAMRYYQDVRKGKLIVPESSRSSKPPSGGTGND